MVSRFKVSDNGVARRERGEEREDITSGILGAGVKELVPPAPVMTVMPLVVRWATTASISGVAGHRCGRMKVMAG